MSARRGAGENTREACVTKFDSSDLEMDPDGPDPDGEVVEPDEVGTDLVVVTGVSGGGRSTVARALENVGYYVVDNLPQALMLDMAELAFQAGGAARRTAMVLDVRSRAFSTDLTGAVAALR